MFRFLTAGESHGPGLVAVVEGLPAGLEVTRRGIADELARRRQGHGRSRRMDLEMDDLEIMGGIRFGKTLGSPVAVLVRNTEWPKWSEEMSPQSGGESRRPLTTPRPGHADLAGMLKYDTHDARDVLERASARETAARTVVGHLARLLLEAIGVSVLSHVVTIGDVTSNSEPSGPGDREAIDRSPVRCIDEQAAAVMVEAIDQAREQRNTLGGSFQVLAFGTPAGIGSHVHHDRRLDARLGAAIMSIPGIKGFEIGDGLAVAAGPGSEAHDEIHYEEGGFRRSSGRAGGIEGGMSNGETIRLRGFMKPLSTLMRPLDSVDVTTKEKDPAFRERSDVCAVPSAGVVGEAVTAIVLAQEAQRKFGGDTLDDFVAAASAYQKRLAQF